MLQKEAKKRNKEFC